MNARTTGAAGIVCRHAVRGSAHVSRVRQPRRTSCFRFVSGLTTQGPPRNPKCQSASKVLPKCLPTNTSVPLTFFFSSTSPTMPTTAYDAELRRCPRAPVGAPDDNLFGQTIQPALNHIQYTPIAHSCAKETSQLATGELWCRHNAEICALTGLNPLYTYT